MSKVMTLRAAVSEYVHSGDHLAIGGYTTSRKPMAVVNEIIRQGQTDFIGEGGPAGSDWDMLIGAGRVRAYVNCYTANPRFSNVSRRFQAAAQDGTLCMEDYSQDAAMLAFHAAGLGLPYVPVRMMLGSGMEEEWGITAQERAGIPKLPAEKFLVQDNPFHPGEKLLLLPTPQLDLSILHVQMASPDGTCRILGDVYHDADIAFAARRTIVTCEELVTNAEIRREPEKNTIPGVVVDAVVHLPYGAHPSQVYGFYDYDKAFYREYDRVGRREESFQGFLQEWVYDLKDHMEYLEKLGVRRLLELKVTPGFGYHVDTEEIVGEGTP